MQPLQALQKTSSWSQSATSTLDAIKPLTPKSSAVTCRMCHVIKSINPTQFKLTMMLKLSHLCDLLLCCCVKFHTLKITLKIWFCGNNSTKHYTASLSTNTLSQLSAFSGQYFWWTTDFITLWNVCKGWSLAPNWSEGIICLLGSSHDAKSIYTQAYKDTFVKRSKENMKSSKYKVT